MDTKKLMLYRKYFKYARVLTGEQFGNVMFGIGDYFYENDESAVATFSNEQIILYEMMRDEMKLNWEKYEKTCQKRSEAGKKSAEKRREMQQMLTSVNSNSNTNKKTKKNTNTNTNSNKNSNIGNYDFEEIERLALQKRLKNKTP